MTVNIISHPNGTKKNDLSNSGYRGKPITEIITNGLFTVDHQWIVQYWNKAAEKLLKVKAADIMGKNIWEEFADTLPINFYSSYHKAFLQDIPLHFEEYWAEKGIWFDVITYYCNDQLSVSFKSSGQILDIERPEAPVQQLKILTELYRFVTEITNDCLWEWNLQTDELFWIDGGHKRVFGYPIVNALIPFAFWRSRIHPEDVIRVITRLKQMISEGKDDVCEDEYRFQHVNGEYAYVHDRAQLIYDDQHVATRMIGATHDITSRKLTELKLLASEKQISNAAKEHLREITRAVLIAQEKERTDIGRELHDNLNQILGAAKMYVEMAKTDQANLALCLNKSSDYIVQVIEEIRNISKAMAAPVNLIGFLSSIKMLMDDMTQGSLLKIKFYHNAIIENLMSEPVQVNIFRIIQEQMGNIIKHAKATKATLRLTQSPDKIILLMTDNGIGLDLTVKSLGVGIINIKSRAEGFGGTVNIVSQPQKGFSMTVELPLLPAVIKNASL